MAKKRVKRKFVKKKKVAGRKVGRGNLGRKKVAKKKVATRKVRRRRKGIKRKAEAKKDYEENPIGEAIDRFMHRVWGIKYSVSAFLPEIIQFSLEIIKKFRDKLIEVKRLLESGEKSKEKIGWKELRNVLPRASRLIGSDMPEIAEGGYFLSLFSAFDAFVGELLCAIYQKEQGLFSGLNRSMAMCDIVQYDSVHDIKLAMLQSEIECFRRQSYVEQFEDLERRFDIKLKKFKRWPQFVECAQRRNIIMHCGGIVSEQYLKVCRKEGCSSVGSLKVGDRLELNAAYLAGSCELMMEVGLKLGQTLWRKVVPDELKEADEHLIATVFDLLKREKWGFAQVLSKFGAELPRCASDVHKRIIIVNYAIALKFGRRRKAAEKVLSGIDWSATSADFKLAEAVLLEKYDGAAKMMEKIGKEGELIHEHAYHDWPLFRKFRESKFFSRAYEKIYGYSYDSEAQRIAEVLKDETERKLRRRRKKLEEVV